MHSHSMSGPGAMNARSTERRHRYIPPAVTASIDLIDALRRYGRGALDDRQLEFLRKNETGGKSSIYFSGDIGLLEMPAVSIVGTRDVSPEGAERAGRLAVELSAAGVLVVSGLAKGVDTYALRGAIEQGGVAAAVIGTPLEKAYPAENAWLQEEIYSRYLLISPFKTGSAVNKGNFPARNRVMAALSDATVIVEASDTSGTLHQAAECLRLGRWLFILKSVADDKRLQWPSRFLGKPFVEVLTRTQDVIDRVK